MENNQSFNKAAFQSKRFWSASQCVQYLWCKLVNPPEVCLLFQGGIIHAHSWCHHGLLFRRNYFLVLTGNQRFRFQTNISYWWKSPECFNIRFRGQNRISSMLPCRCSSSSRVVRRHRAIPPPLIPQHHNKLQHGSLTLRQQVGLPVAMVTVPTLCRGDVLTAVQREY